MEGATNCKSLTSGGGDRKSPNFVFHSISQMLSRDSEVDLRWINPDEGFREVTDCKLVGKKKNQAQILSAGSNLDINFSLWKRTSFTVQTTRMMDSF